MAKTRKSKGRRSAVLRGKRKRDSRRARKAAKAKALALAAQTSSPQRAAQPLVKRRQHRRYQIHHPLQTKCETWSQFLNIYTQNISTGGMFLVVDQLPNVGTRLELRFDLPNHKRLILHAHVAHVVTAEGAAKIGGKAGFGLKLDALTLEEEAAVEHLVQVAKQHMKAPPPPLPPKTEPSDG